MDIEQLHNAARTADRVTTGGAGLSVFGWMTINEFAALAGVLIALVGGVISGYCKLAANKRWREEHDLIVKERARRVAMLEAGQYVPPDPAIDRGEDE